MSTDIMAASTTKLTHSIASLGAEVSSRLSVRCCENFVKAGAPEILFKLITTCNRSLPHMELLRYVLMTITNVASRGELVFSVASENAVNVLIDQIQCFRDKRNIFVLATELLSMICSASEECREYVRGNRELMKKLSGIRTINLRMMGGAGNVLKARSVNVGTGGMKMGGGGGAGIGVGVGGKKDDGTESILVMDHLMEVIGLA